MRVLFVNENIGGHATVHAHLRTSLAEHPDVEAQFLDVPAAGLGRRLVGGRVPGLARLDADLQPLRAQLALSDWVRRRLRRWSQPFDVLHVYTGNAGLRIVPLLRRFPSVVTTDATNATNAYRLPGRMPSTFTPATVSVSQVFERPVYRAADAVVASTAWVAESLREGYGVPPDRLCVVPFGLNDPRPGLGAARGTPDGALPRLVFVGHNLERKGALRLIRLHQQHLADECELVIVTSNDVPDGRNVRAVHDVTVGSGRLWAELDQSDVFVFPSPIDQAPNAVIEAMAAGLPVVGLRVGAMPEMVPDDVGRLVPPDDDAALLATIRELIADRSLRADLGAAARRRFTSVYDARTSTARLVDVLHQARARHHAGRVPVPPSR